jgi:hypothetical protein
MEAAVAQGTPLAGCCFRRFVVRRPQKHNSARGYLGAVLNMNPAFQILDFK